MLLWTLIGKKKRTSSVIFKSFSIFPNVSNVKVKLLESKNIYHLEFEFFFWKENIKGNAGKLRRTPGLPPNTRILLCLNEIDAILFFHSFFIQVSFLNVDWCVLIKIKHLPKCHILKVTFTTNGTCHPGGLFLQTTIQPSR